jgi:kumamolisin
VKLPLRYAIGLIAAPLPIIALAVSPAQAAVRPAPAAVSVALRGDVVPALAHATRTGTLPVGRSITVTVTLAQRDQAGLQAFVQSVADPKSPQYKHYLTVKQFAQRFGAAPATVAEVSAYLSGHGLTVGKVTANGLTLTATGSVAKVQQAFGTTLATFHDATAKQDFYANLGAPVLPSGIASAITDVSGLTDYTVAHQNTVRNAAVHPAASKAAAGFTPTTIRKAYNLTSNISAGYTGKGETVAVLEFSAFKQSNITAYDKYYSLSPSTPVVVKAGGGTTSTDGEDEVELDIEVVQAIAPGAAIDVYEAPNSDAGEVALYAAAVSNDVKIISTSWGEAEAEDTASDRTALNTDFAEAAAQGQSIYSASGDSGSDDAGNGGTSVDFPASDPYVTGTGGTTLKTSSSGAWSSETAWDGSGGGFSSYFATPSFQSKVNSGAYRAVPDVAADADPSTGWSIYTEGSWAEYGGTSAAAPNWAAFTAIYDDEAAALGKPALGYANASIYALAQSSEYSSAFHDITSGSNGAYSAGTGYDEVTGWGSYNGGNFLADELG